MVPPFTFDALYPTFFVCEMNMEFIKKYASARKRFLWQGDLQDWQTQKLFILSVRKDLHPDFNFPKQ